MQDDDGGPLGLEGPKRAIQRVPLRDQRRSVLDARDDDGSELDLDRTPPASTQRVETGIDDESMEPRVEPIRVSQRGQVTPGSDARLLDRVPRQVRVPEDQSGGSVQARDGGAGKHSEGVMIASLGPLDERSLVHVHPSVPRTEMAAFSWYGALRSRIVPIAERDV